MRVTTQMFYDHFLSGLQLNNQAELTDNDQISSGKKISRPSDDPSGLWKVVDYQTQLSEIGQYQQAMNSAKEPVQSLDSSFTALNNALVRANTLAINGADASNDGSSRTMISDEVQTLYDTALSTANTQVSGRYIFAGYQSNVNPIDPTTGEFISDKNSFNTEIASGINVTTNVSAGSLFSFKRQNTTDSSMGIVPDYNWTNSGANTIPDADPSSALQTAAPAAGNFTASNAVFTTNGGSLKVTVGGSTAPSSGAFVINSTNNTIVTNLGSFTLANGVYTGSGLASALSAPATGLGIAVTYDATNHAFKITGSGGTPATTVNFGSSAAGTTTLGQMLGFKDSNAGTIGTGIPSDNAVGDVNLAAGSTLQDVRDALNTAGAGVKAEVVNEGTSAKPDFRLVVASNPAGSSDKIDISVLSNPRTTSTSIAAGGSATGASLALPQVITAGVNDKIHFSIGGVFHTATILPATYNTSLGFANAIQAALTTPAQGGVAGCATVTGAGSQLTINNTSGSAELIDWAGSTVTPQQLGFGASAVADVSGTGVNMLSYDKTTGMNMTLGTDVTNYNYIKPLSANDSIVIDSGTTNDFVIDPSHNKIVFNDTVSNCTATIKAGTYSGAGLAAAIQAALKTSVPASTETFAVDYGLTSASEFTIKNTAGANNATINWGADNSIAPQQLGYTPAQTVIPSGGAAFTATSAVTGSAGPGNGVANNQIVLQETGFAAQTVTIARGTYTPTQLASAIQTALNNAANPNGANTNAYSVAYDPNAMKFKIAQTNAAGVAVNFQWNSSNTTGAALLGFNPTASTNASIAAGGGSVQSDNSVLANYYSFNNNYLNDSNILRALNFEKLSLQHNDTGRIGQSLTYLNDLMDAVSQSQAKIGATENEITAEGTYQTSVTTNVKTFMSDVQDTDFAKVSADLAQRQTTLQALRTISAQVLNQNLFDFVKF